MVSSNRIDIEIRATDHASSEIDKVQKKAGGLGSTLKNVGAIAGGFLAANVVSSGVNSFISGIGSALNAASDLNESVNAVNVVFGDAAGTIHKFGETAAETAGLTRAQFNQLAAPIGAMLQNMEFSAEEAADATVALGQRAADMASIFNTDVSDALAAISAGLRGEADPLERYGVSLKAATVTAKALADTGKESAEALTAQELATARVALIMEQTNSIAGDFVNTSGEAANAARVQAAQQEELAAQIGQHLLPLQLKWTQAKAAFVELLATKVVPAVEEFARKHLPAVKQAIQDVVAFVQEWWPKLEPIFRFLFEHFKTQVEGFIQQVQGIIQIITGLVEFVTAIVHGDWSAAWNALKQIAEGALTLLRGTIDRFFGELPSLIISFAGRLAQAASELGKNIVNGIVNWLKTLPEKAAAEAAKIPGAIASAIGNINISPIPGTNISLGSIDPTGLLRASGGPVSAGRPYIVGEGGPEWFVPNQNGTIVPMGAGIGGGNIEVNFNGPVYARDEADVLRMAGDVGFGLSMEFNRRGL